MKTIVSKVGSPVAASTLFGVLLLVGAVQAASAADAFSYGAGLAAGHSDNIKRVAVDVLPETTETASVDLSARKDGPRLKLSADGMATYIKYVNDAYASDLLGSFNGAINYDVVPDRFSWSAYDNFAQTILDQTSVDTPNNREDVNYFTTGPTLGLRFGSRTRMSLSGHYSKVDFSVSPYNQDRFGGALALTRNLSAAGSLSAGVSGEKTEFVDQLTTDYRTARYFAAYQYTALRTRVLVDGGYTQLRAEDGYEDGNVSGRIEIARQISRSTSVRLQLGTQYSDTGSMVRQMQDSFGAGTPTNTVRVTAEPFVSKYATLAIDFDLNRTKFSTGVSVYRETYRLTPGSDRTFWIANMDLRRQFTANFSAYVMANHEHQNFILQPALNYNESHGGVGVDYQIGSYATVNLQVDRFTRSRNAAATQFHENQIWLTFSYGIGQRPHRYGSSRGAGLLR